MGAAYYRALDRLALPYTYWAWKFIAGSIGYQVERPWTVKFCRYFWPAFSLLWSPVFALIFFHFFGQFWALLALIFLPPVLTVVLFSWILRLTIGPPFVRFVKWLDTSQRVKFAAQVIMAILAILLVLSLVFLIASALFDLWNALGWFAPLIVLGVAAGAALFALLVIVGVLGIGVLSKKITAWADSRPPRPEHEKQELPAPMRAIGRFLLVIFRTLGAILAFFGLFFYLLYARGKQFCPTMTYEASGSPDDPSTAESE